MPPGPLGHAMIPVSMSGHGNRYDPSQRKEALEILRRGGTVIQAAEATGASRQTIYRWARAAKVDPPGPWVFDREGMRRMFAKGASIEEVMETYGCSIRYAYAVKSGELT